MSLPACFVAAADARAATPIVVLDRASFPAWRDAQPPSTLAWLDANAFVPSDWSYSLVPGDDGRPRCVVAAIGDAADPLALSHLPQLLPPGDYALDAGSPVQVDSGLALLGWGLGAYKFDKYVAPTRPPARLVLAGDASGDGREFALLRASTLVRDLVNTPTEHMGPDELEAVGRRLAQAYGATINVVAGDELLEQNFPSIHVVGRASHRAPRLIELNWGDAAHKHVVICRQGRVLRHRRPRHQGPRWHAQHEEGHGRRRPRASRWRSW